MKPGTIIRLPDGREGTVTYHGLIGYGIRWGRIKVDVEACLQGNGNTISGGAPSGYEFMPEAMLRDPYPQADLECVGDKYEIIEE